MFLALATRFARRGRAILGSVWLTAVLAIFWSAWEPFSQDMRESGPVVVVLVALVGAIVLLPPIAWVIAAVR
jgi:hypothetical protein